MTNPRAHVPQRVVGMFGAGAGKWTYDVSRYMTKIRKEIKPTAHTVAYLKELSEHSLPELEPEPEEELPPPVVQVFIKAPSPLPEPEPPPPPPTTPPPSGLCLLPFCSQCGENSSKKHLLRGKHFQSLTRLATPYTVMWCIFVC